MLLIGLAHPGARVQAQDPVRLEGQPIAVTPEFEPERRPITFEEEPAAMYSVGGDTEVTCLAYSPDGKTLAVGDGPSHPTCTLGGPPPTNENGGLIRLIDTSTRRVRMTLRPPKRPGREYQVDQVVFSPDGTRLLARGWECLPGGGADPVPTYRVMFATWDPATGREHARIVGSEERYHPSRSAISPDARWLAEWDRGAIRLRDAPSGEERHAILAEQFAPFEFSPDGKLLATGVKDGGVKLWDLETGRELARFAAREQDGERFSVQEFAFSLDSQILAAERSIHRETGGEYTNLPEVVLYDLGTRRQLAVLPGRDGEYIFSMTFFPDGKTFATGSDDGSIRLWETASGRRRAVYKGHESWLFSLLPSPDGRTLAAGDRRSVTLWDVKTGTRTCDLLGDQRDVKSLAFSPDGRTLASAGGGLKLWDLRVALEPKPDEGHLYEVTCVAYSPDGRTLASGSEDRTVKLWDTQRRRPRMTLRGHFEPVVCLAYAPDGRALASGGQDGVVKLWDTATGRDDASFRAHADAVLTVAFSPDGRTVASGSGRQTHDERFGEVNLWDARTGEPLAAPDRLPGIVNALAFSPDGSVLALGYDDDTITLRDLAAGGARATLAAPAREAYCSAGILCLAYSPDGKVLAAGSRDQTVGLWDIAPDGARRVGALKHSEYVVALAFSRDGKHLATCDRDENLRVWDIASRTELAATKSPTGWFTSVSFSPDGRGLAAGNRDTSILIWDFEKVLASRRFPR